MSKQPGASHCGFESDFNKLNMRFLPFDHYKSCRVIVRKLQNGINDTFKEAF